MPEFSKRSKARLESCHIDLQEIFNHVIEFYDCNILEGYRDDQRQAFLYQEGFAKEKAGKSKHNKKPSLVIRVSPYPIYWEERERFILFGGYVKAVADIFRIKIRWGGDGNLKEKSFNDLVYFELIEAH
jgi:hypothetical protein